MREKFPALWVLQFVVLFAMGTVSLCFPDFVLHYSRGIPQPVEPEKPIDELHDWVFGLNTVPRPSPGLQAFFGRKAAAVSQNQQDRIRYGSDGFWLRNAIGVTHAINSDDVPGSDWNAVKEWILDCGPALEDREAWGMVQEWIRAVDEFPEPNESLLKWIHDPVGPPPLQKIRQLIFAAQPTEGTSWRISAEYVRQSAPPILAAALFTLFGMLSASIRRPLARIFVLVFLFWTVGISWGQLGDDLTPQHAVLFAGLLAGVILLGTMLKQCPARASRWTMFMLLTIWWTRIGVLEICNDYRDNALDDGSLFIPKCLTLSIITVAFLGIVNAYYWLIGPNEDPPQDDAGIAQGRPPQLWTIWLAQFVVLAFVGLYTLMLPHDAAHIFTQAEFDRLNTQIVDHSVRMLGVWVLSLALFSFFALGSARDWIWQGMAVIFCVTFVVFAVCAVINLDVNQHTVSAYLYGFQGLLFVPITVMQIRRDDPWSTENIESENVDWQWSDLSIGLPLLINPLLFGRRTMFHQGVGAGGVLRMNPLQESDFDDPKLKGAVTNPFFSKAREFPIQLRFSNRTQDDDTSLDIRGCALRLSVGPESPLDMLFSTGSFAPIRSLRDAWHILPFCRFKRRVASNKTLREGLVAGLRRAPKSFTVLTYYSQLVLEWRVPSGCHYLCRFRLVPVSDLTSDDVARGLPTVEDLKTLWDQTRLPNEPRSKDYLRQRLYDRLTDGTPVTFSLQVQLHAPKRDDSLEWYDASLEWDERTHPWLPLGELVLNRLLTAQESESLRFDPRNCPRSLRHPRCSNLSDLDDPRSLAAAQYRVISILGRVRLWRRPRQEVLHTAGGPPVSDPAGFTQSEPAEPASIPPPDEA